MICSRSAVQFQAQRGVDDMAALAVRLYVGQEDLNPVDDAKKVNPDLPLPVGRWNRLHLSAPANACVIADDMHVPKRGERLVCGALQ